MIADNGRKDVAFQIGDWVFIHLRPYRKLSLRLQRHTKLSQRFFGPFQLLQWVGEVSYNLNLPSSSKIHPVFHVSTLWKCLHTPNHQVTPIDIFYHSSSLMYSSESILYRQTITRGAIRFYSFYQVAGATSWGFYLGGFLFSPPKVPDLNLEDKVHLHGCGNVTDLQGHEGALRRNTKGK